MFFTEKYSLPQSAQYLASIQSFYWTQKKILITKSVKHFI